MKRLIWHFEDGGMVLLRGYVPYMHFLYTGRGHFYLFVDSPGRVTGDHIKGIASIEDVMCRMTKGVCYFKFVISYFGEGAMIL